jgi:3',5'-cyclic AMP phosphodiesterase CpdA
VIPLFDPRLGDIEDDASSTKQRSIWGIAGNMLAEISLPKLALSWLLLIAVPGVLVGLAPLFASGWLATFSRTLAAQVGWLWFLILLAVVASLGWIGGRPVFRTAEQAFWALNAAAVQPGYVLGREALRHLAEGLLDHAGPERRSRIRAASAAGGGLVVCGFATIAVSLAWPHTRWLGEIADLASPHRLIIPALANTVMLVGGYLAAAALVWGFADATMGQPRDLSAFDPPQPGARTWRVAHLSDVHTVGERYGFRIESGRSGPRGNDRLKRALARLNIVHAERPVDLVLVTGDMTDAGRSTEWAEFLAVLAAHPQLAERVLILPGNHDVNIVDRANPARFDLPTSPGKRLRQMRTLSAMAAVQGDRVRVVDAGTGRLGRTLSDALAPHRHTIAAFADAGGLRHSAKLERLWADVFPMVLPPVDEDGLGVVLLNSNAETHFSFTNALGLLSVEQMLRLSSVAEQFPRARWILALHHHLVEYPAPSVAFSERIGTALVNGTWFVRQLQSLGGRVVVMHGHRHINWIGECGGVRIISAPSPVMEGTNDEPAHFHVQVLAAGADGRLCLLTPEHIDVPACTGHT